MNKCSLFQHNSTFLVSPSRVESSVSVSIFREFLSRSEGNAMNITDTKLRELDWLREKFGFSEIAAKHREFGALIGLTSKKQK
jgi:hypothetical protein